MLGDRFQVIADGRTLTPQWSAAEIVADRNSLRLPLRYTLPARPGVVVHAVLSEEVPPLTAINPSSELPSPKRC